MSTKKSRSSVISPLALHVATVQNSTWKLFPVGGMTFPSAVFIGPFIVPENSATEHVWLPSVKRSLYGRLVRWLSGKVLKDSIASTAWLDRPLGGRGPPRQE